MLIKCNLVTHSIFVALYAAQTAYAQDYPSKPVRIVTAPAGGGADLEARIIAQRLTGTLNTQVIVDNRPSDVIGDAVAKAAADGYTLLLQGSVIWIEPLMRSRASYDPVRDLSPISMLSTQPNVLAVHPSLPVKSVADLIALAKSKPGALNYAAGGTGSGTHLAGELFKSMARVEIERINYKGTAPALSDLIGGQVQMMFPGVTAIVQFLRNGKLKAVAVTSVKRSALYPYLPTVGESGLAGYKVDVVHGLWAPARTPEPVVRKLNQEVVRMLGQSELKEKFAATGTEPSPSSPEQFSNLIRADMAQWGKLIKEAGIRID
jgi:tripartite-type tricarboxylate transporter receptor subunit TctC